MWFDNKLIIIIFLIKWAFTFTAPLHSFLRKWVKPYDNKLQNANIESKTNED